jgi:hypothetical protein
MFFFILANNSSLFILTQTLCELCDLQFKFGQAVKKQSEPLLSDSKLTEDLRDTAPDESDQQNMSHYFQNRPLARSLLSNSSITNEEALILHHLID